jgi:hypothetical protein
MPTTLNRPEQLAGRVADQLEATVQVLRQSPLTGADIDRVARQLQAEADLLMVIRRSLERCER